MIMSIYDIPERSNKLFSLSAELTYLYVKRGRHREDPFKQTENQRCVVFQGIFIDKKTVL